MKPSPQSPAILSTINSTMGITPLPEATEWKDFLENCPPGEQRWVKGFKQFSGGTYHVIVPELNLFCESEICGRKQMFKGGISNSYAQKGDYFLRYTCRNCGAGTKTIYLCLINDSNPGEMIKYGEVPNFGAPIPAKLQRLIQPHRELFLKGYRCENQGLGIGAFSYYRRVVENEKNRLISEIIKVCGKVAGGESFVPTLEKARKNHQFSKAVEEIAEAIPDALRINGHNPLTLLHAALSKHIHNESDEACLEAAHAIRVVLTDLAERMSELLKEKAELQLAIEKLMKNPAASVGCDKKSKPVVSST